MVAIAFGVGMTAVGYPDSPVIEWTLHFKNDGKADTPILEEVQALDLSTPVAGNGVPVILYSRGAGGMDTYSLQKKRLNQLEEFHISNDGWGKTGETIPFFDVRNGGQGGAERDHAAGFALDAMDDAAAVQSNASPPENIASPLAPPPPARSTNTWRGWRWRASC
jgi:hypothetical protein